MITLQSLGVPVKFISVPGKDHAFEHFASVKYRWLKALVNLLLHRYFCFSTKQFQVDENSFRDL
jgi:hypothetical protein